MQADDKKEVVSIVGKHFIFKIGMDHRYKKPVPILLRTGVKWDSLLGTVVIPILMQGIFWKEWAKVWERYPEIKHKQKCRTMRSRIIPSINYIAPENKWIDEFSFKQTSLIEKFIPRFKQLLLEQVLPYWIFIQIIPPLLTAIDETFSKEDARDFGQQLLIATIEAFQSTGQIDSGDYRYGKFYSFVLNLLQESFLSKNYAISVSKTLVDYRISVTFLKDVYALHPKNNAALNDLWQWFHEDKDCFGKKFDKYWLARQYQKSEIESFKKAIIPVLPPDEECEDMPEPYTQPQQAFVSTLVGWVSTSSPAESLSSGFSFSPYFYPPGPMYFVPTYQLMPPHVPQYHVPMQEPDFMLELVSSMPETVPIEESKLSTMPTTILESMQTSYSSNQRGFLVGRNKVQDQSNVGVYYQYR